MKNVIRSIAVVLGFLSVSAYAAVDVTAVTTYLSGDAATAIATVGGAMLIFMLGMRIWKWLRRTF